MSITRQEMLDAAIDVIAQYTDRLTLRQIYYRLVSTHTIENTKSQYKRLSDVLARGREDGAVSWDAIEDRGRQILGSPSIGDGSDPGDSVDSVMWDLKNSGGIFMPRWWKQTEYVEVWLEKQALEGIFQSVTGPKSVVLMPCKGYPSASFLKEAADRMYEAAEDGRNLNVIYFGDMDPSGKDIERYVEEKMNEHGIHMDSFERVAITQEQIDEHNIPPFPTKQTDSRSAAYIWEYGDVAVELDALDPPVLKELIEEEVGKFFDSGIYKERREELDKRQTAYRKQLIKEVKEWADTLTVDDTDDDEEDEEEEDDEGKDYDCPSCGTTTHDTLDDDGEVFCPHCSEYFTPDDEEDA